MESDEEGSRKRKRTKRVLDSVSENGGDESDSADIDSEEPNKTVKSISLPKPPEFPITQRDLVTQRTNISKNSQVRRTVASSGAKRKRRPIIPVHGSDISETNRGPAVQPNEFSFSQSTLFDGFTEDDRSNLLQCMFPGDQCHDLSNMINDGSPPHTGTDCLYPGPKIPH